MRVSAVPEGDAKPDHYVSVFFAGGKALVAIVVLVALLVYAQPWRSTRHSRRGREHANSRQKHRLDVSKINSPDTRDSVGPHSEGEAVVRVAILLSRLKFSPGEITSNYNENLTKASAAFQSVSGLPEMGAVDAAKWTSMWIVGAQEQSRNRRFVGKE
jgi:hypothetical protein